MNDPYRTQGERLEDMIERKRDWGDLIGATFWIALVSAFAVGLVALVVGPLLATTFASGKADYCFVEPETYETPDPASAHGYSCGHHTDGYTLKQHVPWRSDRTLARQLKTPEETRQEAAKYGCEIR